MSISGAGPCSLISPSTCSITATRPPAARSVGSAREAGSHQTLLEGDGFEPSVPRKSDRHLHDASSTISTGGRPTGTSRKARREESLDLWPFFDRVDAIGVKGEIILDRRDGGVGSLVTPHRVDRALA